VFVQKILRLILTVFAFLFALAPFGFCVETIVAQEFQSVGIENIQKQILSEKLKVSESYVVSANFIPLEISAGHEREENFVNCSLDRGCSQNKFLQEILNSKYNQKILAKSHNISSYLKNEICARAP